MVNIIEILLTNLNIYFEFFYQLKIITGIVQSQRQRKLRLLLKVHSKCPYMLK